jgi:hypothetical protein
MPPIRKMLMRRQKIFFRLAEVLHKNYLYKKQKKLPSFQSANDVRRKGWLDSSVNSRIGKADNHPGAHAPPLLPKEGSFFVFKYFLQLMFSGVNCYVILVFSKPPVLRQK